MKTCHTTKKYPATLPSTIEPNTWKLLVFHCFSWELCSKSVLHWNTSSKLVNRIALRIYSPSLGWAALQSRGAAAWGTTTRRRWAGLLQLALLQSPAPLQGKEDFGLSGVCHVWGRIRSHPLLPCVTPKVVKSHLCFLCRSFAPPWPSPLPQLCFMSLFCSLWHFPKHILIDSAAFSSSVSWLLFIYSSCTNRNKQWKSGTSPGQSSVNAFTSKASAVWTRSC